MYITISMIRAISFNMLRLEDTYAARHMKIRPPCTFALINLLLDLSGEWRFFDQVTKDVKSVASLAIWSKSCLPDNWNHEHFMNSYIKIKTGTSLWEMQFQWRELSSFLGINRTVPDYSRRIYYVTFIPEMSITLHLVNFLNY